jgi:hypothetical protein
VGEAGGWPGQSLSITHPFEGGPLKLRLGGAFNLKRLWGSATSVRPALPIVVLLKMGRRSLASVTQVLDRPHHLANHSD